MWLSNVWKYVTGGAVALATVLLTIISYGRSQKSKGASEAATDIVLKDAEKRKQAREAAYEEKRSVDGISDSDLISRLRRRDGDWGRL